MLLHLTQTDVRRKLLHLSRGTAQSSRHPALEINDAVGERLSTWSDLFYQAGITSCSRTARDRSLSALTSSHVFWALARGRTSKVRPHETAGSRVQSVAGRGVPWGAPRQSRKALSSTSLPKRGRTGTSLWLPTHRIRAIPRKLADLHAFLSSLHGSFEGWPPRS